MFLCLRLVFLLVAAPTEIYTLSLHDALPIFAGWKICASLNTTRGMLTSRCAFARPAVASPMPSAATVAHHPARPRRIIAWCLLAPSVAGTPAPREAPQHRDHCEQFESARPGRRARPGAPAPPPAPFREPLL